MQRFTISLDDKLAQAFHAWMTRHGHANRSEAVRDLLRAELERSAQRADDAAHCVASLSYVYRRDELDASRRVGTLQHDHHDLVVSSTTMPLDHEFRLETLILRGATPLVRRFADLVCAQRGVRHGHLNLIRMEQHEPHRHAPPGAPAAKRDSAAGVPHRHLRPTH